MSRPLLQFLPAWPLTPAGASAAWQYAPAVAVRDGRAIVALRCVRGHWFTLAPENDHGGHRVNPLGVVTPGVECPHSECGWHAWVVLDLWRPLVPAKLLAVVVHHSEESSFQPVDEIEVFHCRPVMPVLTAPERALQEARGWAALPAAKRPGRGWRSIAYHYLIDGYGRVRAGCPENQQGSHCPGWNDKSFGVCVLGDLRAIEPLKGQVDALTALLRDLQARYPRRLERILGHVEAMKCATPPRDPGKRDCPGTGGTMMLETVKRRLSGAEVGDDAMYRKP